jgi:hypothetical protein
LFFVHPYPINDGEVDLLGQAREDTNALQVCLYIIRVPPKRPPSSAALETRPRLPKFQHLITEVTHINDHYGKKSECQHSRCKKR